MKRGAEAEKIGSAQPPNLMALRLFAGFAQLEGLRFGCRKRSLEKLAKSQAMFILRADKQALHPMKKNRSLNIHRHQAFAKSCTQAIVRRFFVLFFSIVPFFPGSLQAQHLEVGGFIGASNYQGDLSNNSSAIYFRETHPAAAVFGAYNMNAWLNLKLAFTYATLSGKDANSNNEAVRRRNLSFRSPVYELGLTLEFNLPGFDPYNLNKPFSAYLFAGLGYSWFKPKALYAGNWVALQPLGTEGQGLPGYPNPYRLNTLVLPMGIGLKYAVTDKLSVGLEVGARRAFTDYLDDVSGSYVSLAELAAGNSELSALLSNRTGEYLGTEPVSLPTGTPRGDQSPTDWYFLSGIRVSWHFLDNGLMGSRKRLRRNKRSGCNN